MSAKYFVTAAGEYIGCFDGHVPREQVIVQREESGLEPVMLAGKQMVNADGTLRFREVKVTRAIAAGWRERPKVYPPIPAGAIEVPAPPPHALDYLWSNGAWVKK